MRQGIDRALTFSSVSLINQYLSVRRHALHADVHLLARGVVEELHLGFALSIGGDVGLPPNGAAEVRHGRYHAVVLRLECGGLVKALEVGAAKAFVALGGIFAMGVEIYSDCHIGFFGTVWYNIQICYLTHPHGEIPCE